MENIDSEEMNTAEKNNLRKLSFLGFAKPDGHQTENEVQLDDECAKVFAMEGPVKYEFHDTDYQIQSKFDENDFEHHRHEGYPHMHSPLKSQAGRRSMKKRQTSHDSQDSPGTPTSPSSGEDTLTVANNAANSPTFDSAPTLSPLSGSIRSKLEDSETGPLNSPVPVSLDSESESECAVSDPCTYHFCPADDTDEKKNVSFLNGESFDTFDPDGLKKKKKKHHATHRKYSLPLSDSAITKKRHHYAHHHAQPEKENADGGVHNKGRRISTQPEDQDLKEVDKDHLDSHRSDDPRALRRHKTSRPSNASMVNIGKGAELHPFLRKLYDHSPHAIFVELSELFSSDTPNNEREWKETARWIKYEEDVEEGVDRWGKPHVASLSFHSLLNLRKCLENGVFILDLEEKDLPAIGYRVSEELFKEDLIREEDKAKIMRMLLLRHRHVNEHHDRGFKFGSKKHSYTSLQSSWLSDNVGYEAAMMARCSVCSAQGRLCLPHAIEQGRSFSIIGFPSSFPANFQHSLLETERRKFSYPETNLKNGGTDVEHKLLPLPDHHTIVDLKDDMHSSSTEDIRIIKNDAILKRIPAEAQAACVLVGEVDTLEQPAIAFIRLAEPVVIPSLIEVSIPLRFIFILLGPKKAMIDYHEIGRSISTLMSNQQFHNIAYKAENRKELLSAINEFLDDSIVLPPGDWERQALLPIEEIKAKSDAIKRRKENALKKEAEAQGLYKPVVILGGDDGKKPPFGNPLERTRRPWGGLINDLRRRFPYYKSDFKDGLNAQCAAASIFMYFAAVSGAIAFGGLLGLKTENQVGIPENLLFTCVAGIIFALFSGQPLIIIGTTGPLLLFDESLFQFCQAQGIEFLPTRIYIGCWLGVIGVIVAAFEGSVLVKLFTRFTEDIFSALIVLLYIIESIQKVYIVYEANPILWTYCNGTENNATGFEDNGINITNIPTIVAQQNPKGEKINQPNTALFCTVLTLGTFAIAYYLKIFRNSHFLGRPARRALGDFGVPIAIVIMVALDFIVPQIHTDKLIVPEGLTPSRIDMRGWVIPPNGMEKPMPPWIPFVAVVPAMLVYILIFMETHICQLILGKAERKLKKGGGFHLDIVIICLTNIMGGFFGLPWMCAATVRSIAHTAALTVMSRTHAPGEKPYLVEVKEQRLSGLIVSTLIGLSVFMSPLLKLMPMAVLFGIFLYMGVASMDGIQLFDRCRLFFMPVKHHPQASYVRKVRTYKMHIFTLIQISCLAVLWVVKSTKASLAFPFFLILMIPIRKQMERIFSQRELRALDGDQADVDEDEPDFYAEAPLPG